MLRTHIWVAGQVSTNFSIVVVYIYASGLFIFCKIDPTKLNKKKTNKIIITA